MVGEQEKQHLQLPPGAADPGYHLVCALRFLEATEGISPDGSSGCRGNSRDPVCG